MFRAARGTLLDRLGSDQLADAETDRKNQLHWFKVAFLHRSSGTIVMADAHAIALDSIHAKSGHSRLQNFYAGGPHQLISPEFL